MTAKNFDKKFKKKPVNNFDEPLPDEAENWFTNGLHRFIIVFSVVWFAIVAVYITKFFGWSNFFSMVPVEFSGFMASITLPLAIIWVVMAYIDRGSNFKNETRMLRDSLNQVIFPDADASQATKMIADAIKSQVSDLKEAARDVCAQSDVIKRDLAERVSDLQGLAEALDKYSSQTMSALNDEIKKLVDNFAYVAEKAASTTADFRVNTLQIREDSEKISETMTPMVNEMVTAAERVKEVVEINNDNIAKAQEQLNKYSESSRLAIGRIIESWAERGENLEKTFLRTSENCEELFRRLDSGISHIENSISEQKVVVETQSALIDKNSSYLDNKLGEYGKLISLEVEAMIGRSNTLEQNIQTQMRSIRETSGMVSEAFGRLGEEITTKRKLLETESSQVINSINETIRGLAEEMKQLQTFYSGTQDKNGEFNRIFANVAQNLKQIETDLGNSVTDFSRESENIADRFNNITKLISGNVNKLTESASQITQQSENNANILLKQDEYVNKSMNNLSDISNKISALSNNLHQASESAGNILNAYEDKMDKFDKTLSKHLESLSSGYAKTEQRLNSLDKKYEKKNVDNFMQNSAEILQELESLSIDINAIFDKADKDDSLWKKYYEGDHSAFVRYLAKNMSKKEIIAIKESYENKVDFRLVVDKYLNDFEKLIGIARENQRSSTLLAMLSGSDIGKVYYILARALGKVN